MTHLLTGPWGFLPATPEELSATGVVLAVATGLTLDLLGRPALIDGELTSWTSQTLLFLVIAGVIIATAAIWSGLPRRELSRLKVPPQRYRSRRSPLNAAT